MKKTNLSVIIVFCDKDYDKLEHIISSVEKYVLANHEIILVDNRDNQKPFETKYKYVSKGKNCYILEGRRLGLDVAEGDYVWFVDADDDIIDFVREEDFTGRTENILQFGFKRPDSEFKSNININNLSCYGTGVWCRFYKTEALKSFFKPIKRDIDLVNGEDRFILNAVRSLDEKSFYIFDNRSIYFYNCNISAFYIGTKESLERGLVGEENLDYLYSFLPNTKFYKIELSKTKAWNEQVRQRLSKLS